MNIDNILKDIPRTTYETRGVPDKAYVLWWFTGSTDNTKDGFWVSTGTTLDTDWARFTDYLGDGVIVADNLATDAVTTVKIADSQVTTAKLAAGTLKTLAGLSLVNGDILYVTGGAIARLPKGTDGQVLTLASGLPAWAAAGGGGNGNAQLRCWVSDLDTGFLLSPTPTAFTWSVDRYDPDDMHNTSTNKQDIVIDADGDNFYIELQATFQRRTASTNGSAKLQVYVNDVARTDAIALVDVNDGANKGLTVNLTFWVGSLVTSDTVEIRGNDNNDPNDVNILEATSSSMRLWQIA